MVEEMQKVTNMDENISLSADFLSEVCWWCNPLPEWNGVSLIPDQQWTANADFNLWMDASGMGFGAYWDGKYLDGRVFRLVSGPVHHIQGVVCNRHCTGYMGPRLGRKENLVLL